MKLRSRRTKRRKRKKKRRLKMFADGTRYLKDGMATGRSVRQAAGIKLGLFLLLVVASRCVSGEQDSGTPSPATTQHTHTSKYFDDRLDNTGVTTDEEPTADEENLDSESSASGKETQPSTTLPEDNRMTTQPTSHGSMGLGNDRRTATAVALTTTDTLSSGTMVTVEHSRDLTWGYVILTFIVLVIIILLIFIYLLRRANRTHSFNLHQPIPARLLSEHGGTFEAIRLDHHATGEETEEELPATLVVNGAATQREVEDGPKEHQDDDKNLTDVAERAESSGETDNPLQLSKPFVEVNLEVMEDPEQKAAPAEASPSFAHLESLSISSTSSSSLHLVLSK